MRRRFYDTKEETACFNDYGWIWDYTCGKGQCYKKANTPHLDKIFSENPFTTLGASGLDVGLPDGQMGNSEVGHTNMGAGRIVYQELTRITKAIENESFSKI